MPPKKALQSHLTINLDDGEYWCIVMHSDMMQCDVTPEPLLTTPPHSLTDKLTDLQNFLSAWQEQWGKAREDNHTPDMIWTPKGDGDSNNGTGHSNTHNYFISKKSLNFENSGELWGTLEYSGVSQSSKIFADVWQGPVDRTNDQSTSRRAGMGNKCGRMTGPQDQGPPQAHGHNNWAMEPVHGTYYYFFCESLLLTCYRQLSVNWSPCKPCLSVKSVINHTFLLTVSQQVEVITLGVNKTGIACKEFISTVRYKQNKPWFLQLTLMANIWEILWLYNNNSSTTPPYNGEIIHVFQQAIRHHIQWLIHGYYALCYVLLLNYSVELFRNYFNKGSTKQGPEWFGDYFNKEGTKQGSFVLALLK